MMVELHSGERPFTNLQSVKSRIERLRRRLAARFLVVVAALLLLMAVSIDSLQNTASAADMGPATLEATASPILIDVPQGEVSSHQSMISTNTHSSADTYLEFDSETAVRLSYSSFTRASMTRNRLTRAHLFTQRAQ